ncbi:MAG: hypothetical protein QW292_03795 [Candidatus Parvarchaeota archaeon]
MSAVQVGRKANEEELEPLRFKVKGRLAQLLGAESVSDIFVAINELVKNAYYADATKGHSQSSSASSENMFHQGSSST